MLTATNKHSISIFVCHGTAEDRSNTTTSQFLFRTAKSRGFEVVDLFNSGEPVGPTALFSFSDFIWMAEAAAKYECIFLIRSRFRISMQSIKLMQKAHITYSAHLSTPRVVNTRDLSLPSINLRRWLRKLSAPSIDFERTLIECLPFKCARCEAVLLLKRDISCIMDKVSFTSSKSNKCYALRTGDLKAQTVPDAVAFI